MYLEEDVTLPVAYAAELRVGLGAVCADVVESLNAILKRAYKDHPARGGGGGGCGNGIATEGAGVVGLGLVVFKMCPSTATPWGASYRPVYHGQTHGHPKAPCPPPSLCHAQPLFHQHMDQQALRSLFGDLLKAQEDRLPWLLCL